jgi:hypothetical protein
MTERKLFGVIVRVLGLLTFVYALSQWLVMVARLIDPTTPHRFPMSEDALFGVFWIAVGTWLMRRADWLVGFVYGPESNQDTTNARVVS